MYSLRLPASRLPAGPGLLGGRFGASGRAPRGLGRRADPEVIVERVEPVILGDTHQLGRSFRGWCRFRGWRWRCKRFLRGRRGLAEVGQAPAELTLEARLVAAEPAE